MQYLRHTYTNHSLFKLQFYFLNPATPEHRLPQICKTLAGDTARRAGRLGAARWGAVSPLEGQQGPLHLKRAASHAWTGWPCGCGRVREGCQHKPRVPRAAHRLASRGARSPLSAHAWKMFVKSQTHRNSHSTIDTHSAGSAFSLQCACAHVCTCVRTHLPDEPLDTLWQMLGHFFPKHFSMCPLATRAVSPTAQYRDRPQEM